MTEESTCSVICEYFGRKKYVSYHYESFTDTLRKSVSIYWFNIRFSISNTYIYDKSHPEYISLKKEYELREKERLDCREKLRILMAKNETELTEGEKTMRNVIIDINNSH